MRAAGTRLPFQKNPILRAIIATFLSIPFLIWGGTQAIRAINYEIHCGGHLKRAADANTIKLAEQEISIALQYMERKGWDRGGYTHKIFPTPDCDVGFWYKNLHSAKEELLSISSETTMLEKTNVLMKLRETILDDLGGGVEVTSPPNITIFPYQWIFFIWLLTSISLSGVAWAFWFLSID